MSETLLSLAFPREKHKCVFGYVLLYWLNWESNQLLDTKVVIEDSSLPGLPLKVALGDLEIVALAVEEKTGLKIIPERFRRIMDRQISSMLSRDWVELFTLNLIDEEIVDLEKRAKVSTLNELLLTNKIDWSMLGMVLNGIATHS